MKKSLIESFVAIRSRIKAKGSFWKEGESGWYLCYNEEKVQKKLDDLKETIDDLKETIDDLRACADE